MEEMPKSIAAALVKAQRDAIDVPKDGFNKFHGYAYSTSEGIAAECKRALNANGLGLCRLGWTTKPPTEHAPGSVVVRYRLVHEGGDSWALPDAECPVIPEKGRPEDKATAAALTFSAGYVALGLLQIERVDEHAPDARNDGGTQRQKAAKPAEVPPKRATMTVEWKLVDCESPAELAALVGMKKPGVSAKLWPAFKTAVRARAFDLGCPEKADAMLGTDPPA